MSDAAAPAPAEPKKAAKPKKASKPKKPAAHPKYSDMIKVSFVDSLVYSIDMG